MHFVSLMRWWYGLGWLDQLGLAREKFDRTADYFSIGLSFRTLFKPFRQIDADGARKGSLDVIVRAMFDQLFSRMIGSMARSVLIIVGSISLALLVLMRAAWLILWIFIPLLPFASLPLVMSGWIPWL
ncbi:MAG: hypothetical protein ABIR46_03335 [Candidatus Saccharimonadales bacterium]